MKIQMVVGVFAIVATLIPSPAAADVEQYFVPTLEWLVDTCDTIVCVEFRGGLRGRKLLETIKGKDGAELVALRKDQMKRPTGWDKMPWNTIAGRYGSKGFKLDRRKRPTRQLWFSRRHQGGRRILVATISLPAWGVGDNRLDPRTPFMAVMKSFLAVNQYGDLFLTERRLREAISERMKTAQPISDPSDCEVDYWPKQREAKPGHWIASPSDFRLGGNGDHFTLLVPRTKQFRSYLLKELKSSVAWRRRDAAFSLAHYSGSDVIKALQQTLRDNYTVESKERDRSAGRWRLDRVYEVRKAAYRSLKAMGVHVAAPTILEWIDGSSPAAASDKPSPKK